MDKAPLHVRSLFIDPASRQGQLEGANSEGLTSSLSYLHFLTSSVSSPTSSVGGSLKQKRSLDAPPLKVMNKRIKLEHHILVGSLATPVQEALVRFRETSEMELGRLRRDGYDSSASISKLIDKMKTTYNNNFISDSNNSYSREDLDLVVELSGFNEEGAVRALVLRDEIAKLRVDGFNHPEAIDELSLRMRRLVGAKRRSSLPPPLSPTSARRLAKRVRKAKSMGNGDEDTLLSPPFTQQFNFEDLVSSTLSSSSPLQPPLAKKRNHDEDGHGDEEGYLAKRQRLLDSLDVEAARLNEDDREVTLHEGLSESFAGVGEGGLSSEDDDAEGDEDDTEPPPHFDMLSDPLSFGDFQADGGEDDNEGLFIGEPFSVETDIPSYSNNNEEEGSGGDEVEVECDGSEGYDEVKDNTDTHTFEEEQQVWQYNPLLSTKKHNRRDNGSSNRPLF